MTGGGKLARCCERATISLASRVAVVVGTLLNLINHYDVLFGAPLTRAAVIQIALTYLVPYFVSTHGQVWSKI